MGKESTSGILSWGKLAFCIVLTIASIGVALLIIPGLSLNAAIRGGTIAIGAVVGVQLALRLKRWISRRD